jgi:hypothetical protein
MCATRCIEVGEKAGIMLHPTLAYGILAKDSIDKKDGEKAKKLTKRYLQLCSENGIYEYFRLRKAYDPILEFAYENDIEPEFTKRMMAFAGFSVKKVFIETLGGFNVFQDKQRQKPLKIRTKKERELLAFLLDAGDRGATKEQIYNAIWWESESMNVKNLIAVNLANIKKDMERAGIEKSVVSRDNRYYICRDEIECDTDLFEKEYKKFIIGNKEDQAKKLLSLYKGEYLSGFEALWAVPQKMRYCEIYEEARRTAYKTSQPRV